jgi:hypothetical protein
MPAGNRGAREQRRPSKGGAVHRYVRPFRAAHVAAGPDGVRGSGPYHVSELRALNGVQVVLRLRSPSCRSSRFALENAGAITFAPGTALPSADEARGPHASRQRSPVSPAAGCTAAHCLIANRQDNQNLSDYGLAKKSARSRIFCCSPAIRRFVQRAARPSRGRPR